MSSGNSSACSVALSRSSLIVHGFPKFSVSFSWVWSGLALWRKRAMLPADLHVTFLEAVFRSANALCFNMFGQ